MPAVASKKKRTFVYTLYPSIAIFDDSHVKREIKISGSYSQSFEIKISGSYSESFGTRYVEQEKYVLVPLSALRRNLFGSDYSAEDIGRSVFRPNYFASESFSTSVVGECSIQRC